MSRPDVDEAPARPPARAISDETFAALPVAAFRVDAAGCVVRCNEAFADLVGMPTRRIIGQKIWPMFDVPHRDSPIALALAEGRESHASIEIDSKPYTLRVNPIQRSDGDAIGAIGVAIEMQFSACALASMAGQVEAISRSQAVIEFELDGTIIDANENFLQALGYDLEEITGRHHRIFVDPQERHSFQYEEFWRRLRAGQFQSGEFRRIRRGGEDIWIQATYNPIFDHRGAPFRIVKYATDVTTAKQHAADHEGQMAAVSKAQAIIEFELDGTIIDANENFLSAVGYDIDQIRGRHHRMFVDPEYALSPAYRSFWDALAQGEFHSGQFHRLGRGGRELWIKASYNPIFDLRGRPFKVVKYATDVTAEVVAATEYTARVSTLIERCRAGDLSARAETSGLPPTYAERLVGINSLLDTTLAPVEVLRSHLRNVAQGDLTAKIHEHFEGDHGLLKRSLNTTLDALEGSIRRVKGVAGQVGHGSQTVANSAQALAVGATEQGTALQQITQTMKTLTEQTSQNAENASVASELSASARATAQEGDLLMKDMVTAMSDIDESSRSIRKIIRVIDEIAFQTNLLALNAAVEAARAGAHGKGFAVVAEEVRSLAARSAKAAKETTEMIEASMHNVVSGTDIVSRTAQALGNIVERVGTVTDLVSQISDASSRQAGGIHDINEGLTQVDLVTQTNTASAEEIAATSAELTRQARDLNAELGKFRLAEAAETDSSSLPPEVLQMVHQFLQAGGYGSLEDVG